MAGRARTRGARAGGRSAGADRSWPVLATAPAATSGPPLARVSRAPSSPTQDLRTNSTYRMLLMRGLAPVEAANLTAFLSGIHVGDQHWDLKEVNRLLFLRDMQRTGRFGKRDGEAPIH